MMKTVARFLFACLFGASFPLTVHSAPVVSEIMASNARTLADDDGDFSDWIEIYNPSPAPLSLNGYFLTDDSALLTKWQFPDIDRKSTRLNSSHSQISYAVFCLKKKKIKKNYTFLLHFQI